MDTDFVKKHPTLNRGRFPWAIPLGLHGDAGAFSDNDSHYALSWNSLMGSGSTITKRIIFTVIKKNDMVVDTLDHIFKIFVWSCTAMLSGETPGCDWNGKPIVGGGLELAGGFCGVMCQIRGDWAFYKEALGSQNGTKRCECVGYAGHPRPVTRCDGQIALSTLDGETRSGIMKVMLSTFKHLDCVCLYFVVSSSD